MTISGFLKLDSIHGEVGDRSVPEKTIPTSEVYP